MSARRMLMEALVSMPGFIALDGDTWAIRPRRTERREDEPEAHRIAAIARAEAKRARKRERRRASSRGSSRGFASPSGEAATESPRKQERVIGFEPTTFSLGSQLPRTTAPDASGNPGDSDAAGPASGDGK